MSDTPPPDVEEEFWGEDGTYFTPELLEQLRVLGDRAAVEYGFPHLYSGLNW